MNQVCDGKNDCPNNEVRNLEILKPFKKIHRIKKSENLKKPFYSIISLLIEIANK